MTPLPVMMVQGLGVLASASTHDAEGPQEFESLRWYIIGAVSLVAAAIFAGSEIGIFSISKIRMRLRVAKRDPNALLLAEWLEAPTYALEGLLILANISTFMFEDSVSHLLRLYNFSPLAATLINIAIVTPTVLIFADIMPKDLFHTHADSWMYRLVPTMKWLFRMIAAVGILPLVNLFSRLSMWSIGANRRNKRGGGEAAIGPRAEILTLFQESAATGILTGTQQDLVQRALRLARISVREVMIPWNRVVGVPVSISKDGFRALVRRYNVSRMPVMGRSTTEVLGIVDVIDVLSPHGAGPARPTDVQAAPAEFKLSAHLHPAMTLIGEQNVRSAITLMQRARQTIAVVVDRQNRAIGLVTMKDLIEELVGDLENW